MESSSLEIATSLFKRVNMEFQSEEEESDEDDEQETEHHPEHSNQTNHADENENSNATRRYPLRDRRPLQRYGQNVYEN